MYKTIMEEELCELEEPLHKYKQEFVMAPINELKVIEIQRKPSNHHIKRLAESIRKIGFVVPVIAIRRGENLIIVDGQHRYLAAKEMGIEKLPCIVIPEKYANQLMELNVEKVMSLREKCYVALNVYRIILKEKPDLNEDDVEMQDAIELPYFITLGLAYEENQKFFGSAYESLMRRLDFFLSEPIKDAYEQRKEKAKFLINLDNIAREAVEKVKSLGIFHPFLYKEIISFCNPIGRKRKVEENLEEVLTKLEENLKNLIQNPKKIRAHTFSSEGF